MATHGAAPRRFLPLLDGSGATLIVLTAIMLVAPPVQRLLLTGGRGRLASVIRQHFTSSGARVTCLSRSEGDHFLGLDNLFFNNLIDQTDTLLHLAWSTVPISSERHVGLEWKQDIPLLLDILKAICASPNRAKLHFVFFSSGGTIYGNARDGRPSCESDPCEPIGWYGHGKLAAERIIEEYGRRHGLLYTILRVSNPYGFAVPAHKPQGIIPFIVQHAREGTPLSVWGDGSARKDFLYTSDFTAALELTVQHRPAGIFNVSSGTSHTIQEVIRLTEEAVGRKVQIVSSPAHPWDVNLSLLDNSKFRKATHWEPKVPLSEGILKTVADLLISSDGT